MTQKRSKGSIAFSSGVKLLLCAFFICAVILPLISMLVHLKDADIGAVLSGENCRISILHSLAVSLCATAVSVVIAGIAAYCMTRTSIRLKWAFSLLILLPMLIPSISHGMGLIIILGSNGTLTRFFGMTSGLYGFWGIVIGSVMYAFPVAYLMIADILKYEDSTPYEAAAVLGIPPLRRFTQITLPYLRRPMISVIFATFTLIVTDYGVPLMIGGMYKTLPVLIYEEVIGQQNFSDGSVYGLILLIPAVIAFIIDLVSKGDRRSLSILRPFEPSCKKRVKALSYTALTIISVCVLYPIISFTRLAFTKNYPVNPTFTLDNVASTFRKGGDTYLLNSVIIALCVAVVGVVISFVCAYMTARAPGRGSGFLHLMSILSLAIPGIVLGLSYVTFFSGSFIYGTLAILIMANTVHFFSSPYLMIYNSMEKLNPNLESVGSTLGIGRLRMIRDVIIPQTRSTLIEMFSYFFVNSMMTISAVAFLSNIKTKPISLMIPQFEAQMLLEASAFVSLLILAINLAMKGIVYILRRMSLHQRSRGKNFDRKATNTTYADKETV